MLDVSLVKDRVHSLHLTAQESLIICMATEGRKPLKPTQIAEIAAACGFNKVASWNISRELAKKSDQVIRTPDGWELTPNGLAVAEKQLGIDRTPKVLTAAVASLRNHVSKVKNADAQTFLNEAVLCLEQGLLRAAVVLTWVGAVAVLHDEIVKNRLVDFNAEAIRRDPKWRAAKNADGISRLTEFEQLQVFEAISLIGKNVKQELELSLKLRNSCGHPNSYKIGENKVAAHIEVLTLNVFGRLLN